MRRPSLRDFLSLELRALRTEAQGAQVYALYAQIDAGLVSCSIAKSRFVSDPDSLLDTSEQTCAQG
jgi:hypothetical protein